MILFVSLLLSLVASQSTWIKVTYNDKSYTIMYSDLTINRLKFAFNIAEIDYLEDLSGKFFYPSLLGTFEPTISSEVVVRQLLPKLVPTAIYPTETRCLFHNSPWVVSEELSVGYNTNVKGMRMSFIHFKNLTSINSKKTISKVYLRMMAFTHVSDLPAQLFVHRCETDWQGMVNWSQKPYYREDPYSSRIITEACGIPFYWDVTGIVEDWVKGVLPNYGILIKTNNTHHIPTSKNFHNNDPEKKPCLLVYYSE